jgi:hypothetical protein
MLGYSIDQCFMKKKGVTGVMQAAMPQLNPGLHQVTALLRLPQSVYSQRFVLSAYLPSVCSLHACVLLTHVGGGVGLNCGTGCST